MKINKPSLPKQGETIKINSTQELHNKLLYLERYGYHWGGQNVDRFKLTTEFARNFYLEIREDKYIAFRQIKL